MERYGNPRDLTPELIIAGQQAALDQIRAAYKHGEYDEPGTITSIGHMKGDLKETGGAVVKIPPNLYDASLQTAFTLCFLPTQVWMNWWMATLQVTTELAKTLYGVNR